MNRNTNCAVWIAVAMSACSAPPAEPGDAVERNEPALTPALGSAAAEKTADGYTIIRAKQKDGRETEIALKAPPGVQVMRQPGPDPHAAGFPLAEALAGLPKKGTLTATIHTTLGVLECDLFEDKAPNTVANFVGLARGLRKFVDSREGAWVARKYYDGTTFHRVIPDFMIQGGDYLGTGAGFTGYVIPDELHPTLKHDRAGLLCMANRGPNTNSAQFFITEGATPHLDNSYTIFGECQPVDVVHRIARVPQAGPGNTPITPVVMERVEIARRTGPRAAPAAGPAGDTGRMPTLPPGVHIADKVPTPTPTAPNKTAPTKVAH